MTTSKIVSRSVDEQPHPAGHARAPAAGRRWPGGLVVPAAAGLLLLNVLVLSQQAAAIRAAVGLPLSVILPGALALRIVGGRDRRGWDWLLHAVALSLVALMAVAAVLGLMPGAALTPVRCLLGLDVLVVVLAVGAILSERATGNRHLPPARPVPQLSAPVDRSDAGVVGIMLGTGAVALVVLGARQLNAGGGPGFTMLAIGVAVAALAAAMIAAGHRQDTAAGTVVFLVALAVLLATSLRGAGVTGHDIKIEYRVFTDTLSSGSWQPGGLFSGYNSCLSITVLPAFFARLLGIAAPDVYRVCFQLLFATVPVGVYLGARRLVPPRYAVMAAGLVVAFPTFVNDMPMLNRQEIALIFFTVMVLTLMDVRRPRWQRLVMFTVAAAGLTVSHYASAFVAAGLLLLAWVLRRIQLVLRRQAAAPGVAQDPAHRVLGLGLPAISLLVMAVGWPLAAGSATTFASTARTAIAAVTTNATVGSVATGYSHFWSRSPQPDAELLGASLAQAGQSRSIVNTAPAQCRVQPQPSDVLPPTPVGATMAAAGVSPQGFNAGIRAAAVVLFQIGAVAGVALLWWRARHRQRRARPAVPVLAELGAAGLVLLAVVVAAPQLSDAYGLLRLYQQLLVVLAPAVILALLAGVHRMSRRRAARRRQAVTATLTALVVLGCMTATTGLVPRLTGGYPPQLNLASAGPYFRAYYAGPDDVRAITWMGAHLPARSAIIADSRDAVDLLSLTTLSPEEGLAPGVVPADAHVLTRSADGRLATAVAVVGERVIRYSFPLACVAADRPVVHRSGTHRLYGPVVPR